MLVQSTPIFAYDRSTTEEQFAVKIHILSMLRIPAPSVFDPPTEATARAVDDKESTMTLCKVFHALLRLLSYVLQRLGCSLRHAVESAFNVTGLKARVRFISFAVCILSPSLQQDVDSIWTIETKRSAMFTTHSRDTTDLISSDRIDLVRWW